MKWVELAYERRVLLNQISWLIGLRWVAAGVAIFGSLADWQWLGWYEHGQATATVGLGILIYNTFFSWLLDRPPRHRPTAIVMAWAQILLDLACLTLLVLWTSGASSPLIGFFVLHMVFASLLLPRAMAFGTAGMATIFIVMGLALNAQWPQQWNDKLLVMGWATTLLLTVYLTNHITISLRRHRQRLLDRNRRVRQLAQRLRRQQAAMVQYEKMSAMGQLAAGVAHEIANPLASMDSVLQLIQRHPERMTGDKTDLLRQQIKRIERTMRQMTDFAHPTQYSWETICVNKLVESALEMVRLDPRRSSLRFEPHLQVGDCTVRVQPHAMQQVLVNIMLNALDAVDQVEQPQLAIRNDCVGNDCRISVIDNGCGIDAKNLDHIFEPFFTTKPVGKGTGLGLAISYSLVHQQNGRLEVQSELAKGTKVVIYLPRVNEGSDPATTR